MLPRILYAALLLVLLPSLALAQAPAPADADAENVQSVLVKAEPTRAGDHDGTALVLPSLPHGTYILRIPESGPVTVETAVDVKVVGPGPLPPDPPGPGPVLNDFSKKIKALADKATGDPDRVNTAQGLAMLYRGIASEAHRSGTTATEESVSNTTLMVTDLALQKQGASAVAAWADMRAALRAGLVNAIQTGKSVTQMGDLLDQAATGLEASAPKSAEKAPSPEFWAFMLKLLEMLLPLLLPLLK